MSELCSLPARLLRIARMASPCRVLADIGTDHAHLPVYMLQQGLCSRAFACDVNEGPLQRARVAVAHWGMDDRIETVKSDGLKSVPEEYDTLVIAGMGGDLISKILADHPPRRAEKIILQPMTKAEVLRNYLFTHGYRIRREEASSEGDRHYIILDVIWWEHGQVDGFDRHLPQNLVPSRDALDYLEKLLSSHQRRLLGLRRADSQEGEAIAFEEELCRRYRDLWTNISRRLHDETD